MQIEQVEKLLVEVGELLDLPQITAAEEEPSWHLLTRDGEVVHVDFEQETSRLYLSVGIGKAHPDDYGILLTFSSLWKKTHGLHCALEGTESEAVLVFSRVASYLQPPRFAGIIEDIVGRAAIWRAYLERPRDSAAAPPLPSDSMMIRA